MNETTSNDNEITPEIKSDNILDNNISQELKTEINESVQSIDKSKINENISSTNNTADINDNKKIEEENVTDIKVNDESNNMEKTDISEKVDEDDEELEIQNLPKPSSHCYSYNITNLSNNREDLGAGFRSRLRNINSPTRTTSTSTTTTSTSYSYTNNNVNPHPSYNPSSDNKKTTTTTTSTTSSTTTSTTTTTHIPSIKIKDDIKIPDNNSTSYKSSQESSIPNPTSSSTNTPKPTPTTQSNNINNNTNKNHTTDNNNNNNDSSSSSAAAGKQEATNEEDEEEKNRHMFECNICLDTASDPVVTMCGHFYCWPCIAMWLERSNQCPVCKSGISKEKIIPVYARGAERKDPREKDIPHRPAGHREEPEPRRRSPFNFQTSFSTFGLFPGFSFTFSNGGNQAGFNQGGFFNPFNLGPEFPQPESQSRTGHGQGQGQNGQNGQGGQGGGDPNDYQNYILSAFLFFIVFSILSSILFNF